jgi:hypothetical protein
MDIQEIAEAGEIDDLCNRLGTLDVLLEQLPPRCPRRTAALHQQEILRNRIDMLMQGFDLPAAEVFEPIPLAA